LESKPEDLDELKGLNHRQKAMLKATLEAHSTVREDLL
jgi:hypothetical protein